MARLYVVCGNTKTCTEALLQKVILQRQDADNSVATERNEQCISKTDRAYKGEEDQSFMGKALLKIG